MTSDDDPPHDCGPDPETILGIRAFENVLFADDTETPVDILAGKTPAHSQATVEKAKGFAVSINTKTPQIASPASVKMQVERQGKLYTSATFFHFEATGSLERHRAYHATYDSNAFTVGFEVGYESGNLAITVDRASKS